MIDEILSSPGYEVNPPLSWRIQHWLLEQLQRLLEGTGELVEAGPLAGMPAWVTWIVVGACLVALLLIAYHAVVTVGSLMAEPRAKREETVVVTGRTLTPAQQLREAEIAAAAGDWRRALRELYRAVLLRLDRVDVLVFDATRTNWENARAANMRSRGLRKPMTALAYTVDDCVYGPREPDKQTWQASRALVDVVWQAEVDAGE